MTLRAPVGLLAEGDRVLPGSLRHYLVTVRRLRAGDVFVAFDPVEGTECDAVLLSEAGGVRCGPVRAGRDAGALIWVQALGKGGKNDAVVQDATELGATGVYLAPSARSVARPQQDRWTARQERWQRIAQEAARQSGRAKAPLVRTFATWTEAIEAVEATVERTCLHPGGSFPLFPLLMGAGALAFAVGPEGGLTDDEVRGAEERGWKVVSLGPFALRTETVASAVLGAVLVLRGIS
ncbi:MAG: RsmE family RNA methyltransferase [Myxococcales bacterium]